MADPSVPSDLQDLPSLVDAGRRSLGDDLSCGPLAFGCWRFVGTDVRAGRELIETALDVGMDLVDTADIYGSGFGGAGFGAAEELLGRVLADAPSLRDQMVLATKGGIRPGVPYDSSPEYLTAACDASLRRLGVDHIDLFQIHRPDLFALPHEVAATLSALVSAGKVGAIGVSNHTTAQVETLLRFADLPIVSTQPELSAVTLGPLRDGTLDQAQREGMAVLAWSPLAGGRLATGHGLRPGLVSVLDHLAKREGCDRAAVATAFVLALPGGPVAILGTQRADRLRQAQRALEVHLDRIDCYRIIEASESVPLP